MPIEIRELIIRADVREPASSGGRNSPQGSSATDKKEIIEEAVDRVLEILKRQKER